MSQNRTAGQLLEEHVTLEVESFDRIYLNGYVPQMQFEERLKAFFWDHRKKPVVSPTLFREMTKSFVEGVEKFAEDHDIPMIRFEKGQRKDDVAAAMRRKRPVRDGVVFIGVAQEKAWAFKGSKRACEKGVEFGYECQSVFVKHYYFYLHDREFGTLFIKVCTYLPFPLKICLNGHEWLKEQLDKRGVSYEILDNGFRSCEDPGLLAKLAERFGPKDIEALRRRWEKRLPWPLTGMDRRAGYRHELSIWQAEVALTQVFERPSQGREFFEEVIRENLDLGRPERVALVVDRRVQRNTPGKFSTRVVTRDTHPSIHIGYKHTDIKQYFKEGRALRTETTFHDTNDFGIGKSLKNLPYLRQVGKNINRRLLEVERVGQDCIMSRQSLQRLTEPLITEDGLRVPGLKFGQPRVMALLMALCLFLTVPDAFRNRVLRRQVARLLGVEESEYTASKMSYDLKRLRLNGLINKREGTTRYTVTPYGMRTALFSTKVYNRVLRGGMETVAAPETTPSARLYRPLTELEREVDAIAISAILPKVA